MPKDLMFIWCYSLQAMLGQFKIEDHPIINFLLNADISVIRKRKLTRFGQFPGVLSKMVVFNI